MACLASADCPPRARCVVASGAANGSGVCTCPWGYGFTLPTCRELSSSSAWAIGSHGLVLSVWLCCLALTTKTLARMTLNRKKKDFAFSTSALAWLQCLGMLVYCGNGLAYALGSDHGGFKTVDAVSMAVGLSAFIACALNISLMWIEFDLASKRMESVSGNLKLTRGFLLGFLTCYIAAVVSLMVARLLSEDDLYLSLAVVVHIVACSIIATTYVLGSQSLSNIYRKEEQGQLAMASTRATSSFSHRRSSLGAKNKATADEMHARAKLIISTAWRVNAALLLFVLSAAPWCTFVADVPHQPHEALLWVFHALMSLGMALAVGAIALFLLATHRSLAKVQAAEVSMQAMGSARLFALLHATGLSTRYPTNRDLRDIEEVEGGEEEGEEGGKEGGKEEGKEEGGEGGEARERHLKFSGSSKSCVDATSKRSRESSVRFGEGAVRFGECAEASVGARSSTRGSFKKSKAPRELPREAERSDEPAHASRTPMRVSYCNLPREAEPAAEDNSFKNRTPMRVSYSDQPRSGTERSSEESSSVKAGVHVQFPSERSMSDDQSQKGAAGGEPS
ncbi:hypothetical protein AB1Y20_017222 [Prymnesium parvum]|uniref:EGF-like domain-containing protein n=1 Tax=Prymnesium parvum TaxID=97485 RepID=A0AB34I9X8_PRYPA